MRRFASIIIAILTPLALLAQQEEGEKEYRNGMVPVSSYTPQVETVADSLRLPAVDYSGRVMSMSTWHHPFSAGYWNWDLHEGLNMNLGLSAFTSFGKNSFSGFTQNVAAVYAAPINDRLSFAIGGYLNHLSTGRGSYYDAGFTAMLNYRFNDRLEGFVYAQKAFTDIDKIPYPVWDMGHFGDRIGAGLRYQMSQKSWIQVQFEMSRINRPEFGQYGPMFFRPTDQVPGNPCQ